MDNRTVRTLDLVAGILGLLMYLACGCYFTAAGFLGALLLGAMRGLPQDPEAGIAPSAPPAEALAGVGVLGGVLGITILCGAVGSIGVIMGRRWGHMIVVVLSGIQAVLSIVSGSLPGLIVLFVGVYSMLRLMGKLGDSPQ